MQPHSLAHVLSIAVFGLQWYVEWLQLRSYGPQAKMFTIQPFSKKVCHPLLHSRGSGQAGAGWGIASFQLWLHFQQEVAITFFEEGTDEGSLFSSSGDLKGHSGKNVPGICECEDESRREERSQARSLTERENEWPRTSWGLPGVKA